MLFVYTCHKKYRFDFKIPIISLSLNLTTILKYNFTNCKTNHYKHDNTDCNQKYAIKIIIILFNLFLR